MNELVFLKGDDAFTDSLIISKCTGVEHRKVKSMIRKYEKKMKSFGRLSSPHEVESTGGRKATYYILNEEQATFLITLMKNTESVVEFKARLVKAFYEMRKFIAERHTTDWIETRRQGKITRRTETDVIKELVTYAKNQGSEHADMLYTTYTVLANKMCGIKGKERDNATIYQLNNLNIFENLILQMIRSGIEADMNYKEIYKVCKDRCLQAKQIAMIG